MAKYAAQNGVTTAIRHFNDMKEFTDVKKSIIQGWERKLKEIMASLGLLSSMDDVISLEEKKRG